MSSITINSNTHWIIVTGGLDKDCRNIEGDNVTMIVEMGRYDNFVSVKLS